MSASEKLLGGKDRVRPGTGQSFMNAGGPEVRSGGGQSTLAWLRQAAYAAATGNFPKLIDRLNQVRALGIESERATRVHQSYWLKLAQEGGQPALPPRQLRRQIVAAESLAVLRILGHIFKRPGLDFARAEGPAGVAVEQHGSRFAGIEDRRFLRPRGAHAAAWQPCCGVSPPLDSPGRRTRSLGDRGWRRPGLDRRKQRQR